MLAHVDHGKTTLCDYLAAHCDIVSPAMAGKVRYLDVREDEQEKLITVKTSSLALSFQDGMYNLVDSPGHVEFGVEVSIALRLCDGALVVVDVIDGITSQTQSVLRHAFEENISLCLVLNKIDLLYSSLQLSPTEAESHLCTIVANANTFMDTLSEEAATFDALPQVRSTDIQDNATSEEWFCPIKGNVVFTSGLWGFGFSLHDFATQYESKFGWKAEKLLKGLWGPYTIDKNKQTIVPTDPGRRSLFDRLIISTMWRMFDCTFSTPFNEKALTDLLFSIKAVDPSTSLIFKKDKDELTKHIMYSWLPLARCLLEAVKMQLPSPIHSQRHRLERLFPSCTFSKDLASDESARFSEAHQGSSSKDILRHIGRCDDSSLSPTFAYVVKLVEIQEENEAVLFGLTRVFCGAIRKDQRLYFHSDEKQASSDNTESDSNLVSRVAFFCGGSLHDVESVSAGSICAIGGPIVSRLCKCATLCSEPSFPSMRSIARPVESVMQTVIRAKSVKDINTLSSALHKLNRMDLQLDIHVRDSGEYIMSTAGEVHNERCVTDLLSLTKEIELNIEEPTVSFRETLTKGSVTYLSEEVTCVLVEGITISLLAIPMPCIPSRTMEDYIKQYDYVSSDILEPLKEKLKKSLEDEQGMKKRELRFWTEAISNLTWLGPPQSHFSNALFISPTVSEVLTRTGTVGSFCSGFNLAMSSGRLCGEPLTGIATIVSDLTVPDQYLGHENKLYELLTGSNIGTAMRRACESAIAQGASSLVEPVYKCEIRWFGEGIQGAITSLIKQRRGCITDVEVFYGESTFSQRFIMQCRIPIVESIGLVQSLRECTSGKATCSFSTAGWKIVNNAEQCTSPERGSFLSDSNDDIIRKLLSKIRISKGISSEIQLPVEVEKQKFSTRGT